MEWTTIQERSVETQFCSPATVRHRVPVCASGRRSCLCSTATGAPAPWCPTAGPSRGSQRLAWSLHLRWGWFCSSTTARRCTCLCKCAQADDWSRLCSMATGAPARAHGALPQGPPVARSVAPGRCVFVICTRNIDFFYLLIEEFWGGSYL